MAGFAGTRNSPETPQPFSILRIVSVDEAAYAVLSPGDTGDDSVFHGQRRNRDAVADLVVGHHDIPANAAGPHVERHQVRVKRAHEKRIAHDRQSPVYPAATGTDV